MKRFFLLSLLVLVFTLTGTASADARHSGHGHDWSHARYHSSNWHHTDRVSVAINWHQHRSYYAPARYRMERIYDYEWRDRFPGLRAYRWDDRHGEGFWYRGHRVTNGVFFYDNNDELVSIGFMHNGNFIFIRDDHNGYENHDSFFFSWWNSH